MASRARAVFDVSKANSPLFIPAAQTAVLLMDYQNITVHGFGDAAPHIISSAKQVRDWAVARSIPVYHCLVDTKTGAKPAAFSRVADRWPAYEEKLNVKPELGAEIPELAPAADNELEKTFTRRPGFVSALLSDGLGAELRRREFLSLIVSGISTSGCVLSTVRTATDVGYVVTVIEDACADPVPDLHQMLMDHVLASTAHVATAQELIDAWEEKGH